MHALANAMRLQALRAAAHTVTTRWGLVTNYDPQRYQAKVLLQPEGTLTGWLPVATAWIGDGWGMFAPPSVGNLVSVTFIDADQNAGTVESRFYSNVNQALAVPSGEFWLVHANGQSFKLTNDGKLTVSDGHGAIVALNGDGSMVSQATQWSHTGPIDVNGEVTANGIPLSAHLHPVNQIQTGTSSVDSAAPIP